MSWASVPEIQEQIQKLCEYLTKAPDGQVLTWVEIEQATGVKCAGPAPVPQGATEAQRARATLREREAERARGLVRRALHKLRRPYATRIGQGIELSSPQNAAALGETHRRRAMRATRRAAERTGQLVERHAEDMPEEQRVQLYATHYGLRALQLAGTRSIAKKKALPPLANGSSPVLPKK